MYVYKYVIIFLQFSFLIKSSFKDAFSENSLFQNKLENRFHNFGNKIFHLIFYNLILHFVLDQKSYFHRKLSIFFLF